MTPTYRITVDGRGYAGESTDVETADPGLANGWSGADRPQQVNGIQFGEPVDIVGIRNLRSHVERILRRIGDSQEIVIRRVER